MSSNNEFRLPFAFVYTGIASIPHLIIGLIWMTATIEACGVSKTVSAIMLAPWWLWLFMPLIAFHVLSTVFDNFVPKVVTGILVVLVVLIDLRLVTMSLGGLSEMVHHTPFCRLVGFFLPIER